MAAKDYRICTALADAYIAKVSKKHPNLMTNDRRVIEEDEIMTLIDWWLDRKCSNGEHGMAFESFIRDGMNIHVEFKNSEKQ